MNSRNKIQTQLVCRCLTAVLFLGAAVMIFLSVAQVGGTKISTWDMMRLSKKISEVSGNSDIVGKVVDEYVSSYLPFLLILMILPVVEAACMLIWKSTISAWIGLAGGCINGIMVVTMYAKLRSVIGTFSTWLSFFGGEESGNVITLKHFVFILWGIVYIFIVILSLFHLYQTYGERRPKGEKISSPPQIPKQKKQEKLPVPSKTNLEKSTIFMESPSGILEGKNQLSGQVYPLAGSQILRIGLQEDGCEIPITGFPQGAFCEIEYRQSERAYLLTPNQRQLVYLESGQPLGANRTYTIAKGKRIYLRERTQMFECK